MNRLDIQDLRIRHVGPIDLVIEPGECVVLTGPSGAGKTLLLRSVADLVPHTGKVCLGDTICNETSPPEWRKKVALLPSESRWWYDTVGEHFCRYDKNQLVCLGFEEDVMTWDVRRLSSGEKQRLAILRLLINEPDVFLLDEPTSNLDADNIKRVETLFMNEKVTQNTSLLWVSHDEAQAERMADRHFRLDENRLIPI
jgi:ABC-type iron transport system FetAB ATPase subunit